MFSTDSKILVIDDMTTMRKIVSKNLRALGYNDISEAADGIAAWEVLSTTNAPFHIVISDWNMPKCTGLELLKKVRADSRFASLPFIMLTAEAEASQVKQALDAGVSNYIIKPFTPETLQLKLSQTFKKLSAKPKG